MAPVCGRFGMDNPSMRSYLVTLVFNTLIAGLLTVIGFGGTSFLENLLWSQCVGLSICTLALLAVRLTVPGPRRLLAVVVAVIIGAVIGVTLASVIGGYPLRQEPIHWHAIFLGLFFGGIASGFFWLRERNASLEAALRERELARVEADRRSIEAQLRMLQAQIEPHFLFNSLANVSALVAADPPTAGRLLDALIRYLRASLSRTRAEGGTLGDEVALLGAYLDVLKIRMGDRLRYVFDIPPALAGHALPPMLLQPLVENAVRHGLEPKVEGGELRVTARRQAGPGGDRLVLIVEDDGLGLAAESGDGHGLANVRARLEALFGRGASLRLTQKVGAGVTATVEIPA